MRLRATTMDRERPGRLHRGMTRAAHLLTVAAVLGCGLNAGVFFAFSGFVMAALRRLPAPQGIAAMQSINVTAVRPPLMAALFGTPRCARCSSHSPCDRS